MPVLATSWQNTAHVLTNLKRRVNNNKCLTFFCADLVRSNFASLTLKLKLKWKSFTSEYLTQTRLVSDKRFQTSKDISNAKKGESKKVYEQSKQCGTADVKMTNAKFQKETIGNNEDVSNATCTPGRIICINVHHCWSMINVINDDQWSMLINVDPKTN